MRAHRPLDPAVGSPDDGTVGIAENGRAATNGSLTSDGIQGEIGDRTRAVLDYRRRSVLPARRGWLLHRALLLSDLLGLLIAFAAATALTSSAGMTLSRSEELTLLVLSLPLWIVLMKLYGLYDNDEDRADHSTVDEIIEVFHVVTIGAWVFFVVTHATDTLDMPLNRLVLFWLSAIVGIPAIRVLTRAMCRRTMAYTQNAGIVGTGPVARLVARKILGHPEYGINIVGFVDGAPAASSGSLGGIPVLGPPERLKELAGDLGIERVIVAFTPDSHDYTLDIIRTVRELNIQVDIVPRLFEVMGTNSNVHMLEGIPLLGLPPLRLSPSSRVLKRTLDLAGATLGMIILAPLFLTVALRSKSSRPVCLLPAAASPRRWQDVPHLQVPDHARRRRDQEGGASASQHPRGAGSPDVQGPVRSTCNAGRSVPPSNVDRRAASADQRLPRRDVTRRTAAADPGGRQVRRELGAQEARAEAGNDGTVAGAGSERHSVRRDDEARLPLRDELVPQGGSALDPSHAAGASTAAQGVLTASSRQLRHDRL